MKLDRESRTVKWAYLLDEKAPPRHTSLCAIFWRSVLLTPVFVVAAVGLAVLVSPILVPAIAIAWWRARHTARTGNDPLGRLGHRIQRSVLYQGAIAVKSKACPIVVIE